MGEFVINGLSFVITKHIYYCFNSKETLSVTLHNLITALIIIKSIGCVGAEFIVLMLDGFLSRRSPSKTVLLFFFNDAPLFQIYCIFGFVLGF